MDKGDFVSHIKKKKCALSIKFNKLQVSRNFFSQCHNILKLYHCSGINRGLKHYKINNFLYTINASISTSHERRKRPQLLESIFLFLQKQKKKLIEVSITSRLFKILFLNTFCGGKVEQFIILFSSSFLMVTRMSRKQFVSGKNAFHKNKLYP